MTPEHYHTPEIPTPNFAELNGGHPHEVARSIINDKLIKIADAYNIEVSRERVPDAYVDWDVELAYYRPQTIDLPRGNTSFRKEGDNPDPQDPKMIEGFISLEAPHIYRDYNGAPLNPAGRTGLRGRGILDKWGPTPAADLILLRNNPETGVLETLLINRGDTGELAFPGGKVDPGEDPRQTAFREIIEETGLTSDTELDMSHAVTAYEGYVDDSRNTDNAWMETTAMYLYLTPDVAAGVHFSEEGSSDAVAAAWTAIDQNLPNRMFASHGKILDYILTA